MNLAQAYEAEFSSLTGKLPNQKGVFSLDTPLDETHIGYLAFDGAYPIAFANISSRGNNHEICEFYVIPSVRKRKIGSLFINKIWQAHPGKWEVKQIQGADHAIQFWRKALTLNGVSYSESEYEDAYWGKVNRQIFTIKTNN
nr:GNAT family N-acetyltransferase [Pseudoalteromonas caenipelagi]